jgi:hypothetical protein
MPHTSNYKGSTILYIIDTDVGYSHRSSSVANFHYWRAFQASANFKRISASNIYETHTLSAKTACLTHMRKLP